MVWHAQIAENWKPKIQNRAAGKTKTERERERERQREEEKEREREKKTERDRWREREKDLFICAMVNARVQLSRNVRNELLGKFDKKTEMLAPLTTSDLQQPPILWLPKSVRA
jgi:hypothetical protein